MELKDKVIIITGASSGIGEALAYEFAAKDCKIVIASRNIKKLLEVESRIRKTCTNALSVKADVSIETDCVNIINMAVQKYGTVDVLINNAGVSMRALFEKLDLKVIKQLMDINFWGTVYCTKYALPYLLQNKGSVVGVSSIAGFKGLPGRTGYSASKFAMHGFLEALRIENLKKDLHVMIACPGYTESNIRNTALTKDGSMQGESPLEERKLMTSEEVARRIVKGVECRKHRLVMTSQGKMAVLLNKFFPKMTDRMVFNTISKEPDSPFR
ncbi:MAG: SDR family oxidoreductase [Bacteroidota bacterium]